MSSPISATMTAAGVDTVVVDQAFTSMAPFFEEAAKANAGFKYLAMDGQANVCTLNGATRVPAIAAGTPCVTTWGTYALPDKSGIRPDTKFEANCREVFDTATGETSMPGAPNGTTTVDGVDYINDYGTNECAFMTFLLNSIKKAGKSPTWDKVYANMMKTKKGGASNMSDGVGGFGKSKAYYAQNLHLVELTAWDANGRAKDASGTFNGCPIPVNCWVPTLIDGQEWFPIGK